MDALTHVLILSVLWPILIFNPDPFYGAGVTGSNLLNRVLAVLTGGAQIAAAYYITGSVPLSICLVFGFMVLSVLLLAVWKFRKGPAPAEYEESE